VLSFLHPTLTFREKHAPQTAVHLASVARPRRWLGWVYAGGGMIERVLDNPSRGFGQSGVQWTSHELISDRVEEDPRVVSSLVRPQHRRSIRFLWFPLAATRHRPPSYAPHVPFSGTCPAQKEVAAAVHGWVWGPWAAGEHGSHR